MGTNMITATTFNSLPAHQRTELLVEGLGGKVRRRSKPVCGVGRNDAEYPTAAYLGGVMVLCPAYQAWKNMLVRCYSKQYQQKQPTYVRCYVSDVWLSFMQFRQWWLRHYKDGYALDKDLLLLGNVVYSPSTCLYVPQWLNNLTTDSKAARGPLPIGVAYSARCPNNPYKAYCNDGAGRCVSLGNHQTQEAAYTAWLEYKLSVADNHSAEMEAILPGLTSKVKDKIRSLR